MVDNSVYRLAIVMDLAIPYGHSRLFARLEAGGDLDPVVSRAHTAYRKTKILKANSAIRFPSVAKTNIGGVRLPGVRLMHECRFASDGGHRGLHSDLKGISERLKERIAVYKAASLARLLLRTGLQAEKMKRVAAQVTGIA
ncbi:hypothetical protein MOK15_18355 [Sphingobium sp. BYY-5]|uniref:hypothetical protein n=1 Tax=Sphingobium sp. BYY-5 TaxID=2926400 RepID=UPI001FA751A2|nr:hypothetical protein [Sphingobium sp. BYY-5]MCI4592053.1 hypothetical protein [Sphingobium sp. BYY-5]